MYASDRLAFDAGDPLRPGDPLIPYVTGALDDAARLQREIAVRLRDDLQASGHVAAGATRRAPGR